MCKVLYTHFLFTPVSQQACEADPTAISIFIFQMRTLSFREVEGLDQGHIVSNRQDMKGFHDSMSNLLIAYQAASGKETETQIWSDVPKLLQLISMKTKSRNQIFGVIIISTIQVKSISTYYVPSTVYAGDTKKGKKTVPTIEVKV